MDLIYWIWCILRNFFAWIVENLFSLIDIIASFVLEFLPDSPFKFEPIEWGAFGNIIGFFIPVATILLHFTAILTSITIYYGVRYLLRLIKQIE